MDAGRTPVTVIGLGQMGSALAGALVERGYPLEAMMRKAEAGGHGSDSYASLVTVLRPSAETR